MLINFHSRRIDGNSRTVITINPNAKSPPKAVQALMAPLSLLSRFLDIEFMVCPVFADAGYNPLRPSFTRSEVVLQVASLRVVANLSRWNAWHRRMNRAMAVRIDAR